VQSLVELLKDK